MTEKQIATPVFTRKDEYLDDTHDIIDANGMAIGVSVGSHSLEQVVDAINMHTELVEALEALQDYVTGKKNYNKEEILLMTRRALNKASRGVRRGNY